MGRQYTRPEKSRPDRPCKLKSPAFMKILSLSNHTLLPHLGSSKTRIRWTEGLRRHGHEVKVIQPDDFEVLAGFKKAKKFRYAIGAWLKVWSLLNREDFDLIE